MTEWADHVRYGWRRLWQRPGFTLVATTTLALGLGANIAIFTLVHAIAYQPLPVHQPQSLYRLGDNDNCCVNTGLQDAYSLFSYPLYQHLREQMPQMQSLIAFQANITPISVRRVGTEVAESVASQLVSANYFGTLGVEMAAGRMTTDADDQPDAAPVFVMSHRTWRDRFGADPAIVGTAFMVGGMPMTLAGITAESFFGETRRPDPPGLWIPLGLEARLRGTGALSARPESNWLRAIGRLREDATPEAAETAGTIALRQWLSAQPFFPDDARQRIPQVTMPVVSAATGVAILRITFEQQLVMLFAMSGLVLLIAAANLANLLLARADRGQAAIRVALGASSARMVRESLVEGLLLAALGALAGVAVAALATRTLITTMFGDAATRMMDVAPSLTVLAFAVVLALVTGVLFAIAPALAMARTHPMDALRGAGRAGEHRSFLPRRSFVIAQVTLSFVLLTGAGLLTRSLQLLEQQTLGFEPDQRVVVRLDVPSVMGGDLDRLVPTYRGLVERVGQLPGVSGVSYSLYGPMEGNNWSGRISIQGVEADPQNPLGSSWNRIGPNYFRTLGTPVLQGREITEQDTATSARVAVINRAFAARYFADTTPIGRRLGLGDAQHASDFEVVGVVEDVKYTNPHLPTRPMIFFPAFQFAPAGTPNERSVEARSTLLRTVVLHSSSGTGVLEPQLRRALASVDPNLTVVRVITMESQVSGNFTMNRMLARLTGAYGLLALALASLGLYAVTSYSVATRSREIGVRMALGADRARVIREVVTGAMWQTVIGLGLGLPAAWVAVRGMASQLYGVTPRDPWVTGVAIGVLLVSAMVAAALPARRAASIAPTEALRAN